MTASSWQILSLVGTLALGLGADARTPERAQPGPGFVVLHFEPSGSGASARGCRQDANGSGRPRTLVQEYRAADGAAVTIGGHVALRFKASTSDGQIDSLIAATGVEVFPSATRAGCRRYVIRVVHPEEDPVTVASALQASGLVDYAAPDLTAGRPEGVPRDSFFVDPLELSRSFAKTTTTVDTAPATYGMGQLLSEYTGPLTRVDHAELSAAMASVGSSLSALNLVRTHGLTTLRLEIPQRSVAASVHVVVYSLTGTPVRQLVSESLEAGRYIVGWDGNDDRGRRVQPGVYVAVMTAGSFHETHRLVVR